MPPPPLWLKRNWLMRWSLPRWSTTTKSLYVRRSRPPNFCLPLPASSYLNFWRRDLPLFFDKKVRIPFFLVLHITRHLWNDFPPQIMANPSPSSFSPHTLSHSRSSLSPFLLLLLLFPSPLNPWHFARRPHFPSTQKHPFERRKASRR